MQVKIFPYRNYSLSVLRMYKIITAIILFSASLCAQNIKVLESTDEYIRISITYENFTFRDTIVNSAKFQYIADPLNSLRSPGEPWLPSTVFSLGIPSEIAPRIQILSDKTEIIPGKFILPFPDQSADGNSDVFTIDRDIYSSENYFPEAAAINAGTFRMRYSNIAAIQINPLQFDPVRRTLLFHKEIILKINYIRSSAGGVTINDRMTDDYLRSNVLNYEHSKKWQIRRTNQTSKPASALSWYNPVKQYWKVYLNKKGLYRLTYEQLVSAGLSAGEKINSSKIELFCNGEPVPLHVADNGDDTFNKGDYIQFIGGPPKSSPNSNLNIYNNQNIYWLSFQADSSGLYYNEKNGFPDNWQKTFQSSLRTLHYEVDTVYERLGLADNEERDYWYWGKASGQNKQILQFFSHTFSEPPGIIPDSSIFKLRVNLHGMTNIGSIYPDHNAEILLTSQPIGSVQWDGQSAVTFEKEFSLKNVSIFKENNFQVVVKADIPSDPFGQTSDEIRVNWFELDYWAEHRANGKYFSFISPPGITGKNRFSVYSWTGNSMKVYIPEKRLLLVNVQNTGNQYFEWLFNDSVTVRTEYFCASDDFFLSPDSIVMNMNSDLKNRSNAADYIIIAHPDFKEAASKLQEFRAGNLSGFNVPRVKTVFIQDIYNEFSGGLTDPYAVRDFVKYVFENWTQPAPSYIALMGDMSWDYRGKVKGSRKNFIPSIPYHSIRYGQAVNDNGFVTVAGDDVMPDLAIGRLSCETPAEADILVEKIVNYKAAAEKEWKENILLIGAGESVSDENYFGFNSESIRLEKGYITPSGYSTTKVFRYPSRPEDKKFLGERPEIREAFNRGCVLANFYGHGGGYQWDFVFLNDDIYLLQNENRLPVILSITCYTAHFDNQDVFGEQFNKVAGKGSVGFWGHTGITFWVYGVDLNNKLFNQIFTKKKYVIGDAILAAKGQFVNPIRETKDHISLLTFLGDPALELVLPQSPDFRVTSQDISISPDYPLTGDTVIIKVNIENLGRVFTGDTVSVELLASLPDTSFSIGTSRLRSFGSRDSVFFHWVPEKPGNYLLKADINKNNAVPEEDFADNTASNSFTVYNLSEPYIIKPRNGMSQLPDTETEFLFADIGYYISKPLQYYIELDTSITFEQPLLVSPAINPVNGYGRWKVKLPQGKYFWRTRLYDNIQYGRWSSSRTFNITPAPDDSYNLTGAQLKLFNFNNVIYSDSVQAVVLNTALLPPKPESSRFLRDIKTDWPEDLKSLSSITTDGTYIYAAHMAYYSGPSYIYKIGTGYNGTETGKVYGPLSSYEVPVWHQIFYHSDGNVYIPKGDAHSLFTINTSTGDTNSVRIDAGLLNSTNGKVQNGAFYMCSDGKYVYNISYVDSAGNFRYKIRIFDPAKNWEVVDEINPSGSSYSGFSGFFVADNNCFPYENVISGLMRRIDLNSKDFKEEWLTFDTYQGFYSWTYDWSNDVVYASVYRNGLENKITKFAGRYKEAEGSFITTEIGPAAKWNTLGYDIISTGSAGRFSNILQGYNSVKKLWDTLGINIKNFHSLENLDPNVYPRIRMIFEMSDSSFGAAEPMKFKSLKASYTELMDLSLTNENISFSPDSLLQGFPLTLRMKVENKSYSGSGETEVALYMDENKDPVHKVNIDIPADSSHEIIYEFITDELFFGHKITAVLKPSAPEMFSFNNTAQKGFYVSRDSINPVFRITFDGVEIINGDVISSKPEVVMTLSDNSPLNLADTSRFYIFLDNQHLSFRNDSLHLSSSPYPNSQAIINWKPVLDNGTHTLDVLARDASGNYFDTTSYSISFEVNEENTLYNVYNYPNPFRDETFFTFTLTGNELPQEFLIKIFTVAGRAVREIKVPISQLRFGFNKIYFDGRDQDGNTLANGVYFSKFVVRHKNSYSSVIQKLAKIK